MSDGPKNLWVGAISGEPNPTDYWWHQYRALELEIRRVSAQFPMTVGRWFPEQSGYRPPEPAEPEPGGVGGES